MALEMMKEGQIWELVCRQKGMGFLEAWVWGFLDRLSEITVQEISSLGGTFISLVKKKKKREIMVENFWFEGLKGP